MKNARNDDECSQENSLQNGGYFDGLRYDKRAIGADSVHSGKSVFLPKDTDELLSCALLNREVKKTKSPAPKLLKNLRIHSRIIFLFFGHAREKTSGGQAGQARHHPRIAIP
jgi:hypothetical protein